MKRIVSILLFLAVLASFVSCTPKEEKEISCEDIIAAYENAGYFVDYHSHGEDSEKYYCYIIIY
jgi:hypothetical protein